MREQDIATQLDQIQNSLQTIQDELALVRQQRTELEDLKEDLTRVAKDVFSGAIEEFEDIAPFVRTGDFLHLVKLILRNTNNITAVIGKLESALDFFEDFSPIGKELFHDLLENLNHLDQAHYFDFAAAGLKITDNITRHFSTEDIQQLADNIVPMLETIRAITQPQVLEPIQHAVSVFNSMDREQTPPVSIWKLIREMNTPEMKRNLGFMFTLLKNITQTNPNQIEGDIS